MVFLRSSANHPRFNLDTSQTWPQISMLFSDRLKMQVQIIFSLVQVMYEKSSTNITISFWSAGKNL